MIAVTVPKPGDETQLKLAEVPDPAPGPQDLLIKVRCTALNRADLMQRQGLYPPPPGASPILGMECAGQAAAVGSEVAGREVCDRVGALLSDAGRAAHVVGAHGPALHFLLRDRGNMADDLPKSDLR